MCHCWVGTALGFQPELRTDLAGAFSCVAEITFQFLQVKIYAECLRI